MKITLNGQNIETQQRSLDDLLAEQGYADMIIATAINDQFVPQADRALIVLSEGCVVEVVAPMQGG